MGAAFKPFFINSNVALGNRTFADVNDLLKPVAGNTGNSYITYAIAKTVGANLNNFAHIENVYEYDFSDSAADCDFVKNECSHVFLILQDQIRITESYNLKLPYEDIISFVEKCGKPLVVAGLGANAFGEYDAGFYKKLNPALVKFLKSISALAPEIGIRGYFTAEVLSNIGINNTRVIGCPSFYETGKKRLVQKPDFGSLKPVLTSPYTLPCNVKIPAVLQDFQEREFIDAMIFGNISDAAERSLYKRLKSENVHIFLNPQKWKQFLSEFNFAVGTRVHGTIASINSGLAALCLNRDARAREMCEFLKIPRADISFEDFYRGGSSKKAEEEFLEKSFELCNVDKLNRAYPALYENYKSFIQKQNLPFKLDDIDAQREENFDSAFTKIKSYPPAFKRKMAAFMLKKFFRKGVNSILKRIPALKD